MRTVSHEPSSYHLQPCSDVADGGSLVSPSLDSNASVRSIEVLRDCGMGQANAVDLSLTGNTAVLKDPGAVDASPFEAPDAHNLSAAAATSSYVISTHDASLQEGHTTHKPHQKRRGFSLFSCCSCFGRSKVKGKAWTLCQFAMKASPDAASET